MESLNPTDDDILSISMPIEDFLKFRDRGLYIENIGDYTYVYSLG